MLDYTSLTSVVVLLWYESYGYISRYQLLFYHGTLLPTYMFLFSHLSIISLSCYSVIFYFSVYHVVIVHTVYMHEHFSFSYTLTGIFWRPWICTSRYWMLSYIVQVFVELIRFTRSWNFSLFDFGSLAFFFIPIFVLFLILVYQIQSFSSSLFIWYHAWMLVCDIAVIVDLL